MNCYIELTELLFVDDLPRKLVINVESIRSVKPWVIGTLITGLGGFVHVQETDHQIRELMQHALESRYATLADLGSDPTGELFATSTLPAPVYARNTIRSRRENLTMNDVDLIGLSQQQDRMQEEIRADALGA